MRPTSIMAVLATLFLMSCVSPSFYVEPRADDETLVIGRVLFDCHTTQPGSVPIGEYTYNVDVVFEDDTGRMIDASAGHKGLFYLHNPSGHHVHLVHLSYEITGAEPQSYTEEELQKAMKMTAVADFHLQHPVVFEIQRNKVNNLGRILWEGNMSVDDHTVEVYAEHEETRTAFEERFSESLWLDREWVEIRTGFFYQADD